MLLQILGALERLPTKVTLVWLQGDVNTNVRGDVVALDRCGAARVPLASQVEVVGALSANMSLTDVVLFRGLACPFFFFSFLLLLFPQRFFDK